VRLGYHIASSYRWRARLIEDTSTGKAQKPDHDVDIGAAEQIGTEEMIASSRVPMLYPCGDRWNFLLWKAPLILQI
jgi:hypothetical protein